MMWANLSEPLAKVSIGLHLLVSMSVQRGCSSADGALYHNLPDLSVKVLFTKVVALCLST